MLSFFVFIFSPLASAKKKQEGPLAAAKFYGDTPPAAAVKSSKPTLKEAFDLKSTTATVAQDKPQTARSKGKKCTAQFGCFNLAAFTEPGSGTLYCKEHKPKIPVQSIRSTQAKSSNRRK